MPARRPAAILFVFTALALSSCSPGTSSGGPGGRPAARAPTFAYAGGKQGGCNDVFFHKGTPDNREVLYVSANRKKLGLPDKGSKTFDLAAAPDGLVVAVDLWPSAPRFSAYCNDISSEVKREATWRAIKGKVTITVESPRDAEGRPRKTYKASARLEGVVFEDDAGHQATLKEESINDVMVGWYAG